jgi:hypothetical protein
MITDRQRLLQATGGRPPLLAGGLVTHQWLIIGALLLMLWLSRL